jgi:monoamine oxidase
MNDIEYIDVVIVGAGFAGLSAAKYLSSKSIKCIVIEGRSRVGGRTLSQQMNDEQWTIDLGGQWIGPNQKRILSFIEEFNLQLIEQTWYHHNPNHLGEAIGLKSLTNHQIKQINQINFEWDQMSLELPNVEDALSYHKCSQWDQISVGQFIEQHSSALDSRVQQELKIQILTLTGMKIFFSYFLN